MADIIAQLEVLSRESGCLLDLTAILDLSICPKIDVIGHKPHQIEETDDVICVTPTENSHKVQRRCATGKCYEVNDAVCQRPTVALDLELLVLLGLLTEEQLEQYLKTMGEMDEDESLNVEDDDVGMDPLLSLDVGKDDSVLDLDVGGEDGLINAELGGKDGLLTLDVGGKDGLLNINLLRRRSSYDGLADIDVGGKKDDQQAAIDLSVLQHDRRQNDGILDIDVGGTADEEQAAIDLDVLTKPGNKGDSGSSNGGSNGGSNNGGSNGGSNNGGSNNGGSNNGGTSPSNNGSGMSHHSGNIIHYQPQCGKGFKDEHRDSSSACHATDVNHCLAMCQTQSALLTINGNVQVGDVANIMLCAAIEFNSASSGDNCHMIIAPETEPCHEDMMEEMEDCAVFARN